MRDPTGPPHYFARLLIRSGAVGGRQEGDPLVVDLSDRTIQSWSELWDALAKPCGLLEWFGRNLDAWWDTIDTGAISSVIDEHPRLVVRVAPRGMFAPGNPDGAAFAEVTNESTYAAVQVPTDLEPEVPAPPQ